MENTLTHCQKKRTKKTGKSKESTTKEKKNPENIQNNYRGKHISHSKAGARLTGGGQVASVRHGGGGEEDPHPGPHLQTTTTVSQNLGEIL